MEHTFMTIHNLSPSANILFASESIFDILGYQPGEIQGRSCFDYFHPEEVPFARSVHNRGVQLDKAAVLHYARILSQDGQWISCECCFTVVHDVLVACTSIYRRSTKSERRALEAPQVRRIFSCSPRDPRYHMLEHLSPKFKTPPTEREPRAALILNRFTRTLTVMFATNAISTILGVRPDQIKDKSFYECIAENCLPEAIRCLESAKANDSIAYLRFWCRDPRREEDFEDEDMVDAVDGIDGVDERRDSHSTSDSDDGGAHLGGGMEIDGEGSSVDGIKQEEGLGRGISAIPSQAEAPVSDGAVRSDHQSLAAVRPESSPALPLGERMRRRQPNPSIELEAVVSCTSDGLVVILRKARPAIPAAAHPPMAYPTYENGLFAAPWGEQPIRPNYPPETLHEFHSPPVPNYVPVQDHVKDSGGPQMDHLMRSIRDVAVFAWAIVGINGNMAQYGHGCPIEDAQPHDGLPIWDPSSDESSYLGPEPYRANDRIRTILPDPQLKSGAPYIDGQYYSGPGAHDLFTGYEYRARNDYNHGNYLYQPQPGDQITHQAAYGLPPPTYQQYYNDHNHIQHNGHSDSSAANYAAYHTQGSWPGDETYNQRNDGHYPPPSSQTGGPNGHQRYHWQ